MSKTPDYALIDSPSSLDALCARLAGTDTIALDTEFVRESTYFAQLCLIQVGTDAELACVDCVAPIELKPLFTVLLGDTVTWVVHSAKQDLEVVWHAAGKLPSRLIDTQIAAALLGYPPQIGLQDIVRDVLGIELDKTHTRTNWKRRPLHSHELDYAADDVRHLLPLWRELEARLVARGREAWFHEDCRRLLTQPIEADTAALYARLKGSGRLPASAIPAALALLAWREQQARRVNRPRRWIISDEVVVALARLPALTRDELRTIPGLAPRTAARSGEAIIDAIASAGNPEVQRLAAELLPSTRPDPERLRSLRKLVSDKARSLGIEPEVIAARKDLAAATLGKPPPQLASGWRAELLDLESMG